MLYLRINEILITARVGEDFSLLKTDGGKVAKSNNKERRTNRKSCQFQLQSGRKLPQLLLYLGFKEFFFIWLSLTLQALVRSNLTWLGSVSSGRDHKSHVNLC